LLIFGAESGFPAEISELPRRLAPPGRFSLDGAMGLPTGRPHRDPNEIHAIKVLVLVRLAFEPEG
jgi:hypothetical protein